MLKLLTLQSVTREFAFIIEEDIDSEKVIQVAKSIDKNLIKAVFR